jgi:hypothetical protein
MSQVSIPSVSRGGEILGFFRVTRCYDLLLFPVAGTVVEIGEVEIGEVEIGFEKEAEERRDEGQKERSKISDVTSPISTSSLRV